MFQRICLLLMYGVALSASFGTSVHSADAALRARAREVLEKNKDAVVFVKAVVSMTYSMGAQQSKKQEQKNEILGTVVDPSGLTVVAASRLDPYSMYGDMSFNSGGEMSHFKPETNVTDLKLVLADGTEVAAEFALKDKDLDLAFIRPKEKLEKPLPYLTFVKCADPEVLDEIITIGRLGRSLNRSAALAIGDVLAVVKKPRTLYVCCSDFAGGALGCPVFNSKGEPLGISLMRKSPIKESNYDFGSPVILPAADLAEVIQQALTAKKDEAKGNDAVK